MPTDPENFESSLAFWLTQSTQAYHRIVNDLSSEHGITFRQSQILGLLISNRSLCQVELSKQIGIESPSMVRILDRMERDGWIERVEDSEDRRRKKIILGKKAEQTWQRIVACTSKAQLKTVRGMNSEEVSLLMSLLRRLYRNLTSK